MSTTTSTNRTEHVQHEDRWEYRGADILRVSPGSFIEILEAYTSSLSGVIALSQGDDRSQFRRFIVEVLVQHRDERMNARVGLNFFVDTLTLVGLEHGVWVVAGPTTDASGNRVELLMCGGKVELVTLNAPVQVVHANVAGSIR